MMARHEGVQEAGGTTPHLFKLSTGREMESSPKKRRINRYIIFFIGRSEFSTSRPESFTKHETFPGVHWIGVWVGPRTGVAFGEETNIKFFPFRESNHDTTGV
jgi:hypothetical protein